ncbi:hypothetical protein FB45DRAFT_5923 [Roridomyces roridus]|uniref:Uncharacterized protein n=1 Tax=Roridomyces roridus TaxID=1738132 RepID=A0AAD7G215_9AGAR|nr:hypothetical protein FB45DRAFT_5923 [Roridomyces roridus]
MTPELWTIRLGLCSGADASCSSAARARAQRSSHYSFGGVPAQLLDMLFAVSHRWKDITFFDYKDLARLATLGIAFPLLRRSPWTQGPILSHRCAGRQSGRFVTRPDASGPHFALRAFPTTTPALLVTAPDDFPSFRTSQLREILPLLSPGSHLTLRVPGEGDGDVAPIVARLQSLEITGGSRQTRTLPAETPHHARRVRRHRRLSSPPFCTVGIAARRLVGLFAVASCP